MPEVETTLDSNGGAVSYASVALTRLPDRAFDLLITGRGLNYARGTLCCMYRTDLAERGVTTADIDAALKLAACKMIDGFSSRTAFSPKGIPAESQPAHKGPQPGRFYIEANLTTEQYQPVVEALALCGDMTDEEKLSHICRWFAAKGAAA